MKTRIRKQPAFTLIELLVVISIIAILAAMVIPVLAAVKTKSKVTMTRLDIASFISAAKAYQAERNRYPCSAPAWQCAAVNPDCQDFTYGTTWPDGSLLRADYPRIHTYNQRFTYQTCNAEVVAALRPPSAAPTPELAALSTVMNPAKESYLNVKATSVTNAPGIGPDGVLRDFWGNPYIITFDLNGDGRTLDGFYGLLRKAAKPALTPDVKAEILMWSFGPDGKADPAAGLTAGVNKDNILSWDR
jgi:prepilin-type N-terminal cleavage/methylation domain-containing protein